MNLCSTHIVECLRNDNIQPVTYSSSIYTTSFLPQFALVYSDTNYYSSSYAANQWWVVDFQSTVLVENYSIKGNTGGGWIYNWDTEVSFDGLDWILVHGMRNTICNDQVFSLDTPVTCRFG